jgi:integrase
MLRARREATTTSSAGRRDSKPRGTQRAARAQILARPMNRHLPIPIRAEQRFLFVSELGTPLTRSGLNTAWQVLIRAAIEAKVIAPEERFTLHGLKHRGVTDMVGRASTIPMR